MAYPKLNDVQGDHVIPAGTEVVGCHWCVQTNLPFAMLKVKITHRAIARDPDVFPNGDAFNPARWLDEKGQMRTDLRFFNWGLGRRLAIA